MILTCERCETRFRLDESRLPARGARVRCSRCKHAFVVRPPDASREAAIDELAEQAAMTARPTTPEPSWDLGDADPGSTLQRPAPVAEPPSHFEDENDWKFEDEVPQLGDTGASLDLPNGEAPPPSAVDSNESSFADLGDPESWDLSSSASELSTEPPAAAPPPAVREAPAPVERAAPAAPVVAVPRRVEATRLEPVAAPIVRSPLEPSTGARAAGWLATIGLVAAVALGTVRAPAPGLQQGAFVTVGSLELASVSARLVENALVGPIWVVSGELRNPASQPRALEAAVAVVLLDVDGEPVDGATAVLQPALPAERLREQAPEPLRASSAVSAAELAFRVLEPGARVPVDAVFASGSHTAARIAVGSHSVRRPAPAD